MQMKTAKFKYQVEKIAGTAGKNLACGVFSKSISVSDSIGLLTGLVIVSGQGDLPDFANDVFGLGVSDLESAEGEVLPSLKRILGSVDSYVASSGVEVSFLMAFFYKSACYLLRRGDLVALSLFDPPQRREVDIKLGSGPVEEGQVYLIATKGCFDLFDFNVLSDKETDVAEVLDGMATEISASEDASSVGAIFVKVITEGTDDLHEGTERTDGEEVVDGEQAKEEQSDEEGLDDRKVITEGTEKGEGTEKVEDAVVEQEIVQGEVIVGGEDDKEVVVESEGREGKRGLPGRFSDSIKRVLSEVKGVRMGDMKAVGSMRKKIVIGAILVVLALGVSVGFSVWQKDKTAKEAQVSVYLGGALEKYKEAVGLLELNRARAREILIEAQGEVKKAQEIDSKNPDSIKLASDIESKLKETEINSQVNFEEAASVEEDVKALAFSGKNLIAAGSGSAYQIGSDKKVQKILSDLDGLASAAVFDNKLYFTTSNSAFRGDLSGGKVAKVSDAVGAFDIGVFFGNVYLLKSDQVAKIVPVEGGYADPTDYLQSGENFGQNSRMAIDSLIWVTSGDKVFKFNRGKKEDFEIAGLSGNIGELGPIYTDGNLANLYVIDRGNSVLLVIDKKGNYQKALQAADLANASDLAVNEAEDTVYVAVGSKILKTSLK